MQNLQDNPEVTANRPCPCGSGENYSGCCKRFHDGMKIERPSQLMPARYSAYAMGNVDFIMRTTHPLNPHYNKRKGHWRAELMEFCKQTQFERLEIVDIQEIDGLKEGYVTFKAFLRVDQKPHILHEKSFFVKEAAGWLYRSGVHLS